VPAVSGVGVRTSGAGGDPAHCLLTAARPGLTRPLGADTACPRETEPGNAPKLLSGNPADTDQGFGPLLPRAGICRSPDLRRLWGTTAGNEMA